MAGKPFGIVALVSSRVIERRAIAIRGIVQGVGFRPYVYSLASRLGLAGFVRNQSGNVFIEIEGTGDSVDQFIRELQTHPPPLAQIGTIDCREQPTRGEKQFAIEDSESDASSADICVCPDIATCDDCIAELFDPSDRRWRYPFINCTNCGPRLTIITGAPYDRPLTTMASFEMCPACRREYHDPRDRRFHAQPIACAICGPSLRLLNASGEEIHEDAFKATVEAFRAGKIIAIKGLGGFHLACYAREERAVRELRQRKQRDDKPFAVMTRNVAAAEAFCIIDDAEGDLLNSRARPIVLLRKRKDCALAASVAPGNPYMGVMLPYTPLHHLLLHDLGDMALVMTSGNRSDEPIAYQDVDAVRRLKGIADLFLTHDRPIHVRCDDSVMHVSSGRESPIRRSRGYAPQPLALPPRVKCPQPMLAVGGQLKATFALGRGNQAILSHHLGDLDHLEAFRAFERDIALYQKSFAVDPCVIVHDMHPDYASTRYALRQRDQRNIRCIAVQHHHAHMASCMAEHGLDEPVIGVSFDGTGYGADGAVWGGEFLVGDLRDYRRAAHLRYVPMPGGERAIKEPWRMALAHLADAGVECPSLIERIDPAAVRIARHAIERRINAPLASSAGRLFDAVASLIGVRDHVTFEGQAAMELQWLAAQRPHRGDQHYELPAFEMSKASSPMLLDTRPIIRAISKELYDGVDAAVIALRFHATLSRMITDVCVLLREQNSIDRVVLSGGVFMNLLLAESVEQELLARGFYPFRHQRVPANDGGLSLGQLAVAAKRLAEGWDLGS